MTACEANIDFYSMQYSLLINVFVVGLGSLFFFLTSIWIVKDKMKAENPEQGDDLKKANPAEAKEMLGMMESGALEDSVDSEDVPPTMIISKSNMNNPVSQNSYGRGPNVQLIQNQDAYLMSGARRIPDSSYVLEEKKAVNNCGYHPLNTSSVISKFQNLLDTPDTSNERLDAGHISTSSSTPHSPATPKSSRG